MRVKYVDSHCQRLSDSKLSATLESFLAVAYPFESKNYIILLSDSCYHISFTMRKSRRPKRKHSCWVREWILKREEYGAYHALMNELKISDPSQLRNFLRMSAIDFDNLTNRLGHKLFRRDTSMRAAISVKAKLAVTLRYLASGKQNMT